MGTGPHRSVRVRSTLLAALATAIAMALLTNAVALGVRRTLAAHARDHLGELLDAAERSVWRGDLDAAVDVSGPVVVQVLDADGRVLASSVRALRNAPLRWLGADDDDDDLADDSSDEGDSDDDRALPGGIDADDRDDADDDGSREDDDDAWEGVSAAPSSYADDRDDDADDADDDVDSDDDGASKVIVWHHGRLMAFARGAASLPIPGEIELDEATEASLSTAAGLEGPYIASLRKTTLGDDSVSIVAVASLSSVVRTTRSAVVLMMALSVLVLGGATVFTWLMVGHALRPVEDMRASTMSIAEDDLSGRIEVETADRDLTRLAMTFNDLLERAERALAEQRRFVSDASHQLKSPIAAQRVMIETLRRHPESADAAEVLDDLALENNRLQGIVDDLLALARHDEGHVPASAPVDLIDVLLEEVAALRVRSPLSVDTSGIEPVVVRGDAGLLGQVVRNLLDNASRYARSVVRVSCADAGGCARLVIADDGPGIPPEDRERVFGRFVRLEEGGDAPHDSTGLGLAVVRSIVGGHGGRVFIEESAEGGAAVVVELPIEGSRGDPSHS